MRAGSVPCCTRSHNRQEWAKHAAEWFHAHAGHGLADGEVVCVRWLFVVKVRTHWASEHARCQRRTIDQGGSCAHMLGLGAIVLSKQKD